MLDASATLSSNFFECKYPWNTSFSFFSQVIDCTFSTSPVAALLIDNTSPFYQPILIDSCGFSQNNRDLALNNINGNVKGSTFTNSTLFSTIVNCTDLLTGDPNFVMENNNFRFQKNMGVRINVISEAGKVQLINNSFNESIGAIMSINYQR